MRPLVDFGHQSSIGEQFSLDASPRTWGTPLDMRTPEPDDDLHNPNPARDRKWDTRGSVLTKRGVLNLGCLTVLTVGLLMLFGGYPMITHITRIVQTNQGGFNLGGINGTGQVPDIAGNYGLIDKDTPKEAHKRKSHETGEEMVLVFSDEFNVDGRSFYPGDDPYWEAVDLWYWGTVRLISIILSGVRIVANDGGCAQRDLEWYDPAQVTTKDGALQITLDKTDLTDASLKHNLTYKSGMLQSWNKFCFTGGYIEGEKLQVGSQDEATSEDSGQRPSLPEEGRAGYGATLDGLWPYSYDSCDIGTLPNQTYADQTGPPAALQNGDPEHDGVLSFRPGQRLSACTCPGESHPGPMKKNGDYVGRAAPEIDILEGIVEETVLRGQVSQSSQWAPYNARYQWKKSSSTYKIYDTDNTELNSYAGSVNQQAVSGLAFTNSSCYELGGGCFTTYGFEYTPGYDDAYVAWVNNGKPSWTHYARGLDADAEAEISRRPISQEPMYIIANLGISRGFGVISEALTFPAVMSIDYIRVYQPADKMQISCDPEDYPTKAYIDTYREAYTNPQLTSWKEDYKQPWPKNKLTTEGSLQVLSIDMLQDACNTSTTLAPYIIPPIVLGQLSALTVSNNAAALLDRLSLPILSSLALNSGLGSNNCASAGWKSLHNLVRRSGAECRIHFFEWSDCYQENIPVEYFAGASESALSDLRCLKIASFVGGATVDALSLHPSETRSLFPCLRFLQLRTSASEASIRAMLATRPELRRVDIEVYGENDGHFRIYRDIADNVDKIERWDN
ncbi:hypothetical protein NMY22_g455 [Coprinellus aureogranulatus]|nr:hypothetical protein NMY22_g455 [Coprinellus aureogranulatus]